MKIRSNVLSTAIVLFSLSVLAIAAVDGLSVKRQVKEGEILKMQIKGDFEVAGNQATITAMSQSKVTKIDTDGSYTTEATQSDSKVSIGGQDMALPESPPIITVYNADGSVKMLLGEPETTSASAYRVANLQAVIDPGKPLNVGDAWSIDIKADAKTGAAAAKADYKILGEEKVGDIDTIKVQATVKETSGTEPASSESTYWLEKGNGSKVKSESKWTNVPLPTAPGPISGTMTMTRVN
jgi:hypothetical protein